MGCGSSSTDTGGPNLFSVKGQISKSVSEPINVVESFPYQKQLLPINVKEHLKKGKATGSKVTNDTPYDFIDEYFPPKNESLFDKSMGEHHLAEKWNSFEWKRPAEVYGEGEFSLFKDINIGDIKQGYCGDCYFLSAVCALAEYPERIKAIFETKELNSPGIYSVTFYITGEKKTVTVDDYFPFYPKKQNWAFTQCVGKEIWVMILEKAWAKVHGSYQRIEGGNTAEALFALTGAYIDYIFHEQVKNKTVLWTRVLDADTIGYSIATSASATKTGKHSEQMKSAGIIDCHAYSLISAYRIESFYFN